MTSRDHPEIFGACISHPHHIVPKNINHICRGHNPDQKFTFAYWQSMKFVFDKIDAVFLMVLVGEMTLLPSRRTVNILKRWTPHYRRHHLRQIGSQQVRMA
jgi:hypothetical protein